MIPIFCKAQSLAKLYNVIKPKNVKMPNLVRTKSVEELPTKICRSEMCIESKLQKTEAAFSYAANDSKNIEQVNFC